MCSPDCTAAPHGQDGSSAFPILWSHCRCGPFPVLNHVYVARARRPHWTLLPLPCPATCLPLAPAALAMRRMPPSVAVLAAPATSPLYEWKVACWSASSLPRIPMWALTQVMPVSRLRTGRRIGACLISRSMPGLGAVPFARLIVVAFAAMLPVRISELYWHYGTKEVSAQELTLLFTVCVHK